MKKVELLAPAGSMEALIAAVQNGADAVYLGGAHFGARASAVNFNHEQMREAISYAHLYGVKVYVTVNTLIRDEELDACLDYIGTLYQAGADALIIQDLGLMNCVRHRYPDFELHASTQMHIHNRDGLKMLKKWGIKRGVLARETPLELIKELSDEGIDLEVFVYGAYCVSYSGQCLMSSSIGHRSGNRGECAQSCRLPYKLIRETNGSQSVVETQGKYLLSPKDLNTLSIVDELIEAGIDSFKIEGRMKRPEYVGLVTAMYREAIDAYYAKKVVHVDDAKLEAMQKLFNRGFTLGHLKHKLGNELMSTIRPNHVGIEIGQIVAVNKDKISVKLHHELNQGDGIRILCENEDVGYVVNYLYKDRLLVNHADAGDVVELKRMGGERIKAPVLKTSDVRQLNELGKQNQDGRRKVKLHGKIILREHEPVILQVWDDQYKTEILSDQLVERAVKTPLDEERIKTQLMKTGNTPFSFIDISVELEKGMTFPISALNEMRRQALSSHAQKRQAICLRIPNPQPMPRIQNEAEPLSLIVSCMNEEQVNSAYACGIEKVTVSERELYNRMKVTYPDLIFSYPRIMKHHYDIPGIIQEVGGLNHESIMAGSGLNCFNAQSAAFLFASGVRTVQLSLECSLAQCAALIEAYRRYHEGGNFAALIYGAYENMLMEACPVNMALSDGQKQSCRLCKGNDRYYLQDQKGQHYPLRGDEDCIMHLYHSEKRDWRPQLKECQQEGINTLLVNFTFEKADEVKCILNEIRRDLQ